MSKRSLLFICALLVTLWLAFGQSTANQTSIATAQHMPSDLAESTIAKPNVQQNLSMAINNVQSLKLASRHIAASQFDLFATSPLPPEPLSAKLPAQKKPKNSSKQTSNFWK